MKRFHNSKHFGPFYPPFFIWLCLARVLLSTFMFEEARRGDGEGVGIVILELCVVIFCKPRGRVTWIWQCVTRYIYLQNFIVFGLCGLWCGRV